jgi:RNA polymerase sigma factor (sigma-70 family)
MVRGVCRRVLGDEHDTDDAFQAVFLVLAHRAGTIRKQESVASWLHGVAAHVARRTRDRRSFRRTHEVLPAGELPELADCRAEPSAFLERRELLSVLDDEIRRLPSDEGRALVLHYLEGLSQADTARELGCPAGSMWWRLEQAREGLRLRLTARGVSIPATALTALLAETANASVAPALVDKTIAAALAPGACGLAAQLSEGMLVSMSTTKPKWLLVAVLALAATAGGTYWYGTRVTQSVDAGVRMAKSPKPKEDPPPKPRLPELPADAKVTDNVKENVTNLALLLARNDEKSKKWAKDVAQDVDLEDLMSVFLPRKTKVTGTAVSLGGFGVGAKAGKITPDGIERMLQNLEKRRAGKIDRDAETEMAYRVLAVASIVKEIPHRAFRRGGRARSLKLSHWQTHVDEFHGAARAYIAAVRDDEPREKAVMRLNNSCVACHNKFKDGSWAPAAMNKLSTDELLAVLKKTSENNEERADLEDRQDRALEVLGRRPQDRDKTVPQIVQALTTSNRSIRKTAVSALQALGESDQVNEPGIDEALRTADPAFRFHFAQEARRLKSVPAACQALLQSPDPAIRTTGSKCLGLLGPRATEQQAALEKVQKDDPDPDVRLAAGAALRQINKAGELPVLLRGLHDADPVVRGRSAQALVQLGAAAVPGLRAALSEKNRDIRASAVSALGRIGPPAKEAAGDLRGLLQDDDMLLRKLADEALGKIEPAP